MNPSPLVRVSRELSLSRSVAHATEKSKHLARLTLAYLQTVVS
jgi:hypothetical protein